LKGALIEERAFVEERFRWVERGEEKGKVVLREEVGVRVWEGGGVVRVVGRGVVLKHIKSFSC
jgi:hypothetical protein